MKKNRSLQKQILRLKKKAETIQSADSCCLLTDRCKHKQESVVHPLPTKEELSPIKKTKDFIDSLSSVCEEDRGKLKNSHVAYGMDVPDAETAYDILKKSSKICIYYVAESDVLTIKELLANVTPKPIKGTMSVHQILTTEDESVIKYRDVSCLCGDTRGFCACYDIKDHRLIIDARTCIETNEMNRKVTVLSDITLTEQNKKFIKSLPLSLKEVNLNTYLSETSVNKNRKRKFKDFNE
ncbi:hypothetical protein ACJJTC_013714 [Scirpophaga incertulas]